jgi:hypothetical protein
MRAARAAAAARWSTGRLGDWAADGRVARRLVLRAEVGDVRERGLAERRELEGGVEEEDAVGAHVGAVAPAAVATQQLGRAPTTR